MTTPVGLHYYPNTIPADLAERVMNFLTTECEWFGVPGRGGVVSDSSRRVAHFGHRYDYGSGGVTDPAPPFPPIIEELAVLVYETHDLPDDFWIDQCIINRYLPGQGIGAHYDREEYGEYICCYTLGGGAEMEFTPRRGDGSYAVYTEPRSLYIMSGESRHDWLHQMRPRKSDPGHGKRTTRYSITFRSTTKPKQIPIINGDLVKAPADLVVQQCNCLTVRPHGLSQYLKDKFGKDPYSSRQAMGNRRNLAVPKDRPRPGTVKIYTRKKIRPYHLACLFSQFAPGKPNVYYKDICVEHGIVDDRKARVEWFKKSLQVLDKKIQKLGCKSVAFPYLIGCGLGGGDWKVYSQAIADWAADKKYSVMYMKL